MSIRIRTTPSLAGRVLSLFALSLALAACGSDGVAPTPLPGESLAIVLPSPEQYEGDEATLRAVRVTAGRDTITLHNAVWSASDPTRADLSPTGGVIFLRPGQVTISAKVDSRTISRVFDIKRLSVQKVTLLPSAAWLALGEVMVLGVKLEGDGGRRVIGRAVTLSSDNPAVASIDAAGRVHAHSAGRVTLRATADGVSGTTEVEVRDLNAVLELRSVDGSRLPLLVAADTVTWNGEREYHEVFIELGRLTLTGNPTPRYAVFIRYVEYVVTGPVGQRTYVRRNAWSENDHGLVTLDARGDYVFTSEYIHPLQHTGIPDGNGVQMRFRIPGSDTHLQLAFRKPL
jgi:Bacterial Ig-like domain (group 2)